MMKGCARMIMMMMPTLRLLRLGRSRMNENQAQACANADRMPATSHFFSPKFYSLFVATRPRTVLTPHTAASTTDNFPLFVWLTVKPVANLV
jgi:hypothetical protein